MVAIKFKKRHHWFRNFTRGYKKVRVSSLRVKSALDLAAAALEFARASALEFAGASTLESARFDLEPKRHGWA